MLAEAAIERKRHAAELKATKDGLQEIEIDILSA